MEESSFEKLMNMRKERNPCCTLCRNHNVRTNTKGHKHHCPFKNCDCEPCVKGRKKRVVMSKQVRLRRKQMRDIEGRSNYIASVKPGRGKKNTMWAKNCCSFPKVNLILLFHLKFFLGQLLKLCRLSAALSLKWYFGSQKLNNIYTVNN